MSKFPVRNLVLPISVLLILTALITPLFTYIAYRHAVVSRTPPMTFQPQAIETPFSLRTGIHPSEIAVTLKLPVCSGCVAKESILKRWFPKPKPKSGKGVGLALLRLETSAPPVQIEAWYRNQLGPDFVKTEWSLGVGTSDWLEEVSKTAGPDAVLFLRRQRAAQDGVLLEANHRSAGRLITLFRYSSSSNKAGQE